MIGMPRFGKISRGIWRNAMRPARTTATMATTTVIGRRRAARGRVKSLPLVGARSTTARLQLSSATTTFCSPPKPRLSAALARGPISAVLDRQIVELDDGVGLGPEPDLALVLEGVVLRVEDL